MLFLLTLASSAAAIGPALLTLVNLREYREPPALRHGAAQAANGPTLTVIIPARNEAAGIAACVESVLRTVGVSVRVLVVDDASTDDTAEIVRELAQADTRLELAHSQPLPRGWNGKQYACWQGAQLASTELLCFLDADVRLGPEALARMAALLLHGDGRRAAPAQTALVSGFPRELTSTTLEWLLLPLIHFVLLGLLPMPLLRLTTNPGVSAGCGQFLMVDRGAYMAAGGHAAIRETMHDGIRLPLLMRRHGFATRLADLTELASCRMYRSSAATWNGLAKNATEGLASPAAIAPMTLVLGLGQVLPLPLFVLSVARVVRRRHCGAALSRGEVASVALASAGVVLSYLPRMLETPRFKQDRRSSTLHPIGVATLLALQWYAFGRKLLRRPATWKARTYSAN